MLFFFNLELNEAFSNLLVGLSGLISSSELGAKEARVVNDTCCGDNPGTLSGLTRGDQAHTRAVLDDRPVADSHLRKLLLYVAQVVHDLVVSSLARILRILIFIALIFRGGRVCGYASLILCLLM